MRSALFSVLSLLLCAIALTAAKPKSKSYSKMTQPNSSMVLVRTTLGDITLRLYDDTPLHTANFLKLVKEGYYDGTLFHRVIQDFMIQGGDPDSRNAKPGQPLGMGDPDYTIPAEFVYPKYFHKRGAIAAARQGDNVNPQKASSGSQFYIVTGKVYTPAQLDQMEVRLKHQRMQQIFDSLARENRDSIMNLRRNRDQVGLQQLQDSLVKQTESIAANENLGFTPEQREAYATVGGTPHLDGSYTVFGEVVSGMEVVDTIQKVATDGGDRPKEDVKVIEMRVL